MLTDNELDLSMREADVAIRMTTPTQSDLIQRRLMTLTYHVFAAPSYLQKHGMPRKARGPGPAPPGGVRRGRAAAGAQSQLASGSRAEGRGKAPSSGQLHLRHLPRRAERHRHRRAAAVPEPRSRQSRRDPAGDSRPDLDVYFVYPEELRNSSRITLFRQFILRKVEELVPTG